MGRVLVLGGISSGKSGYAEDLVTQRAGQSPVIYIATADSGRKDLELAQKIQRHQQRRPASWRVYEAHGTKAVTMASEASPDTVVLLDGLGLALAGALEEEAVLNTWWAALDALCGRRGDTVIVTEEVGLGMVPMTEQGRRFAEALGESNQKLAVGAQAVVWVVAGIPNVLRGSIDGAES